MSSSYNGGIVINAMMATRNPTNVDRPFTNSTDFQVHVSQQVVFGGLSSVLDFTEYRLLRCIASASCEQRRASLAKLLREYRSGAIAISWRSGEPAYISMTRER